jgi:hypothetical protein
MRLSQRQRSSERSPSADASRATGMARPGLPVTLAAPDPAQGLDAVGLRDLARDAEAARRRRDEAGPEVAGGETGGVEGRPRVEKERAQAETDVDGGEAKAEGGAEQEAAGAPVTAPGDVAATPVPRGRARRPDVFRAVAAPVLPPTPLPDLSRIRSPLVPSPPASALRRAAEILRSTGSTPEGHHAQVQRAVDGVADRARAAQRNVIFEVGGLASDTRHSIELLAERIPGVVGSGVARIRAAAAAAITDVDTFADAQIRAIAAHKARIDAGLTTRGQDTELQLHRMLMEEAPKVLQDAKAEMDREIDALATEAGGRIAAIRAGTRPAPMDTGVTPEPGAAPADAPMPDGRSGGEVAEEHTTWPAAREALTGRLMGDLPGNRTVQYGNLNCALALPQMVEAQQRAYETANAESIRNLTSAETKARFFDITFGLIMPTQEEEQSRADRQTDASYTGHLNENLTEEYRKLDRAGQSIARQIDEKRALLVDTTLKVDQPDSLPAQSIKALREAGGKIADGLRAQARVVEASLRANLAALSAQYPDLVARLEPLVASGEFLEATATLVHLAEAERSITALERGQIASVADQAVAALASARRSFDDQAASLHKMTGKSVDGIHQTLARARYDFVRTSMMYTGVMDRGVTQAFPAIHAHAAQVAERLLGPKNGSRQQFSNIKTAAIGHLNRIIIGEWQGYLARVNGLEEAFGGVADADASLPGEVKGEFGAIRNGAYWDAAARGEQVRAALTPAPMSTGQRIGGYVFFGAGALAYDIYSNPDESKVTKALSIPWPGPNAVDEVHKAQTDGTGIIDLIRERMGDEAEQADILRLFDPDQDVRAAGKAGLLRGSSGSTGISAEAALALSQSLTADELASPVMSPQERQRIAEELRSTLKPADMEVAASYLNGEPDQALAIRMRQLFDRQAGKQESEQLQTGEHLDRLVREEMFAGGQHAYVPQARLDAMRDAAFLRFDEISRAGREPVRVRDAPATPPPDRAALSPAQLRYQGRPPPTPRPAAAAGAEPTVAAPAARRVPATAPPAATPPPAPQPRRPEAPNETLTPEGAVTDRTRRLEEARRSVVAYMNRPRTAYYRRPQDRYAEADMRRFSGIDRRERTYDPETGRVSIAPARAVQAYNAALIMHGTASPEATGARAAASYARISRGGSLSTNEINELNQNFSDMEYARFRARWEHATPAQRVAMARQWEEVQARHRAFLRETARGMGMEGNLDDPAAVETFVSSRLGREFAKEGERYRRAGAEIAGRGRMSIDTGMALAAGGDWDGTNEALMQNVLANRTQAEFEVRRANGETMRQYAYRLADDELSGGDWHEAKEKLRGEDETELDRFETILFLENQQLEEGTGWLGEIVTADAWQRRHLQDSRGRAESRLHGATQAGIEDFNRRMDAVGRPDRKIDAGSFPLRQPNGELHPLVRRFAMNGDGELRGQGPSMSVLQTDTRQAADFYQAEIDRNEGLFTSIITALAVAISVLLLFIPGVNLIAAGIIVALLTGAATIAVKSGMRGGRYGWEEMAVDVGMTAIEAATAGVGGAMSKGATAAAKAAQTGGKIARLGRVASVGARLQTRFGPVAAPVVQGAMTGAASTAASAALDDRMWDDGLGKGFGRVLGNAAKGGLSGAANAAVTGAITRGLDRRLAPVAASRGISPDRLNRAGRALGPGGRELLTEVLSNTSGAVSAETINIVADLAMERHQGGWSGAFERLGKAGLRELVSAAGRTGAQQAHRARYNRMSAEIHASGNLPSPREMRLLNRLGQSAGVVPLGTGTQDYARSFATVRRRLPDMPQEMRDHVARMGPDKALAVIRMLDTGQLGTRAQRLDFVVSLGKEVTDLDVAAFDRALLKADRDVAPTRRARRDAVARTHRQILAGVRGPERAKLQGQDFSELAGLPSATRARLGRALSEGGEDFRALSHRLIPDDPYLARIVAERMIEADAAVSRARAAVAARRSRIRDDLAEAAPEAIRARVAGLRQRDAAALHAALTAGDPAGLARATAILRGAGLDPEGATRLARRMSGRILHTAARAAHLDNVPARHRQAMLDLPDDALMEIRVAQFTRRPLSEARVKELVAATAARRPGTDRGALSAAIHATMATRHGRPGFRAALAQKRAFLDMIPFGMKRVVHRTPVITLPDDAFLAYVRGRGNEQAVTLIVNGEPVVLVRRHADPAVLAEEGMHVLQYRDPHFRDRIQGLDEGRMARWDDLDLDTQVRVYRSKLDVEIDAQRRMIARLRGRAEGALLPGTRRRALAQIGAAEDTLARLTQRRGEAAGLTAADLDAIAAGLAEPPRWLRQPARMFSKTADDASLMERQYPGADTPVRKAFYDLARRVPGLSRADRRQIAGALRILKSVVPSQELVAFLSAIGTRPPRPEHISLASLPPDQIAATLRSHFVVVGDPGQVASIAARVQERMDAKRGLSSADRRAAQTTLRRLTQDEPGPVVPDLELAKRALVLAIDRLPGNRSDASLMELFRTAASVLGVSRIPQWPGLKGRPDLQAAILEGLSAQRAPRFQESYVKAVRSLFREGIGDFPDSAQRLAFQFLTRAYHEGAPPETLQRIVDLVRVSRGTMGAESGGSERTFLVLAMHFASQSPERITELLPKLSGVVSSVVDISAGPLSTSASAGKVTVREMLLYFREALKQPAIRDSLVRMGSRAERREQLDPDDLESIRKLEPISTRQEAFLTRHAEPLDDAVPFGDYVPVIVRREEAAGDLLEVANGTASRKGAGLSFVMTIEEARSIVQRLEVLEASVAFSALTGTTRTRAGLMEDFLRTISDLPEGTSDEVRNRRGKIIEEKFRRFVRQQAIDVMARIAEGSEISGGGGMPVSLSEEARVALINRMIRGLNDVAKPQPIPDSVRREVDLAIATMREAYLNAARSGMDSAALTRLGRAFDSLVARGLVDTEPTAKGRLQEEVIEALLRIKSDPSRPGIPKLYDEVSSASQTVQRTFHSVDQAREAALAAGEGRTVAPRSTDHVLRVEAQENLPPGMKRGDLVQTDSKAGRGAFDDDQFKRYFVEMARWAAGDTDCLFAKSGASSLAYIADNHDNLLRTQSKVRKVLQEILRDPGATKLVITIDGEPYDLTARYGITPQMIRDNAHKFVVHFGRIAQPTDSSAPGSSHPLGPFLFQSFPKTIAETILDLLDERGGTGRVG